MRAGLPEAEGGPARSLPVSAVTADSRTVRPGDVFVAVPGVNQDGHRFIPQAVASGAQAVVGSEAIAGLEVPYVRVEDSRLALAQLAAAFYDFPARKLTVIGVTGTDGKTTTTQLIHAILTQAGHKAGMISSVSAVIGDRQLDTGFHVTTPDAPDTQRYLAEMVAAGQTHAVIEATSHGLEQRRLAECEFDIGVVTNITHEHLDYHGSYEAYRTAKGILFEELAKTREKAAGNPRLAVLNRDDASYEFLQDLTRVSQLAYSRQGPADLWASDVETRAQGLRFQVHGPGFDLPVSTPLVGEYNVSNCLAAIGATVVGLGVAPAVAADAIATVAGVPGRMERIEMGQDFLAIVDFAHTPNALKNALLTARTLTSGRVIAVFGSAGLRDREKRRMMAEVAVEMADLAIFTAEDPRTESLAGILAEMEAGARSKGGVPGKDYLLTGDRREALRAAVREARRGDLVLACGKGHEQSMCFGTTEYPWDDRVAMRAALAELLGVPGPQMPYLPDPDTGD